MKTHGHRRTQSYGGEMVSAGGQTGFTLLELVVVVMLIGIMTGVVVPLYRDSLRSMRTDRAVTDLITAIKYAQERAVTDGREFRLYIDESNQAYWLSAYAGADSESGERQFRPLTEPPGRRTQFPDTLRLGRLSARQDQNNRMHYVAFHPLGTSDVATIRLEKEDRRQPVEIAIVGRMGRVEVTGH